MKEKKAKKNNTEHLSMKSNTIAHHNSIHSEEGNNTEEKKITEFDISIKLTVARECTYMKVLCERRK